MSVIRGHELFFLSTTTPEKCIGGEVNMQLGLDPIYPIPAFLAPSTIPETRISTYPQK
jgi:hypothetical protein